MREAVKYLPADVATTLMDGLPNEAPRRLKYRECSTVSGAVRRRNTRRLKARWY